MILSCGFLPLNVMIIYGCFMFLRLDQIIPNLLISSISSLNRVSLHHPENLVNMPIPCPWLPNGSGLPLLDWLEASAKSKRRPQCDLKSLFKSILFTGWIHMYKDTLKPPWDWRVLGILRIRWLGSKQEDIEYKREVVVPRIHINHPHHKHTSRTIFLALCFHLVGLSCLDCLISLQHSLIVLNPISVRLSYRPYRLLIVHSSRKTNLRHLPPHQSFIPTPIWLGQSTVPLAERSRSSECFKPCPLLPSSE